MTVETSATGSTILGDPVSVSISTSESVSISTKPGTEIPSLQDSITSAVTIVIGDPVSQPASSSSLLTVLTSLISSSDQSRATQSATTSSSSFSSFITSPSSSNTQSPYPFPSSSQGANSSLSSPSEHTLLIALLGTFATLIFFLLVFGFAYLVRRYRHRHQNQVHRQGQLRLFPKTNSPHNLVSELDCRSGCTGNLTNSSGNYTGILGLTAASPAEAAAAVAGGTDRFSEPLSVVELAG